ncbi:hypothetical protein ACFFHH_14105 [Cytobacillus solani]|nr:hypothetical protein [Cytobacillus solani]
MVDKSLKVARKLQKVADKLVKVARKIREVAYKNEQGEISFL